MEFRFGLFQLGIGISPIDADWKDPSAYMRSAQQGELHRITREIRSSEALHRTLADADLKILALNCKFPDFLGYLGVALFFTMEMELGNKLITPSWVPQLQSMVSPESKADQILSRLCADQRQLQWTDLETVEKDYIAI